MSYLVAHPSEVIHWQRLFRQAGMRLIFQCQEEQPLTGEFFQRFEIVEAAPEPNRAQRRAMARRAA